MNRTELLKRVDHLLEQGQAVLQTRQRSDLRTYVDAGLQLGFRTSALSFIKSLYGEEHIFYKDFVELVKGAVETSTIGGINILKSIRHEIDQDWLTTISQLVSAEIFSDFLEMAKHLLDNKYKDPAAVIIGSVLEEHLRNLCKTNSIDTTFLKNGDTVPKKADTMNADLCKGGAYNLMIQKNVTAWLDLRNNAAHGKYSGYTIDNVTLMYQGVVNFVATHN